MWAKICAVCSRITVSRWANNRRNFSMKHSADAGSELWFTLRLRALWLTPTIGVTPITAVGCPVSAFLRACSGSCGVWLLEKGKTNAAIQGHFPFLFSLLLSSLVSLPLCYSILDSYIESVNTYLYAHKLFAFFNHLNAWGSWNQTQQMASELYLYKPLMFGLDLSNKDLTMKWKPWLKNKLLSTSQVTGVSICPSVAACVARKLSEGLGTAELVSSNFQMNFPVNAGFAALLCPMCSVPCAVSHASVAHFFPYHSLCFWFSSAKCQSMG